MPYSKNKNIYLEKQSDNHSEGGSQLGVVIMETQVQVLPGADPLQSYCWVPGKEKPYDSHEPYFRGSEI